MNKLKKAYLVCSIVFATVVVCLTFWCFSFNVYASSTSTEHDTEYGASNSEYGATEHAPNASDETVGDGGFNLRFDSEDGNFSSTLRMMLVLTIITLYLIIN